MPTRDQAPDAITLLKEDHETARGLLDKLDATTERAGETREKLLARIEQELKIHTTIEEEIFYPAYKDAVAKREDAKLYHEAFEEHHIVDGVLVEIKDSDTGSEAFSAKAKVLKDLVEHHAEEEEKQMFPRARRMMKASVLRELGARMQERKKELQSGGGSWLPAAGRLIAAVAERVAPGRTRPQASVAALGGAQRAKPRPSRSGAGAGGTARRKNATPKSRSKSARRGR